MNASHRLIPAAENLPELTIKPHFGKPSLRYRNKIFISFSSEDQQATFKLSLVNQSVYTNMAPSIIYPVPNKRGKQGWTIVRLDLMQVDKILQVLILSAYYQVSNNPLTAKR